MAEESPLAWLGGFSLGKRSSALVGGGSIGEGEGGGVAGGVPAKDKGAGGPKGAKAGAGTTAAGAGGAPRKQADLFPLLTDAALRNSLLHRCRTEDELAENLGRVLPEGTEGEDRARIVDLLLTTVDGAGRNFLVAKIFSGAQKISAQKASEISKMLDNLKAILGEDVLAKLLKAGVPMRSSSSQYSEGSGSDAEGTALPAPLVKRRVVDVVSLYLESLDVDSSEGVAHSTIHERNLKFFLEAGAEASAAVALCERKIAEEVAAEDHSEASVYTRLQSVVLEAYATRLWGPVIGRAIHDEETAQQMMAQGGKGLWRYGLPPYLASAHPKQHRDFYRKIIAPLRRRNREDPMGTGHRRQVLQGSSAWSTRNSSARSSAWSTAYSRQIL